MDNYEYTPLYYAGLIQVRYYDADTKSFRGGFCYYDKLVDAGNGEEYAIDDIIKRAGADNIHFDKAIVELDWIDLNKAVLG